MQRQRPGTGRRLSRPRTAASAEGHARDQNLKLQLTLARHLSRAERDRATWRRETDRRERDLLLDLARILDSPLTPGVDDWFRRRRVAQVSLLPESFDSQLFLPATTAAAATTESGSDQPLSDNTRIVVKKSAAAATASSGASGTSASMLPAEERQRILEAKRSDWLGLTSVALRQRRPLTAAATSALNPMESAPSTSNKDVASTLDGEGRGDGGGGVGMRRLSRPQSAGMTILRIH